MVRSKRGERGEASREEGGTYWQLMGSAFIAIHDGGHLCRLVVAVCGGQCSHRLLVVICLLMWFVAVHHAPLSFARSCPSSCLGCWPCISSWVTWMVLAVEGACAVKASGVALLGSVHPFGVLAGHRLGLLCASRIFVAVVAWSWYFVGPLLSFLDGWGRVTQWA